MEVSREAETILPILSVAQKNARVLPLIFDSTSAVIDQSFFYEIHAHEANYYHLLVGGGANPTLFPNAMMPVQYQPGVMLPFPRLPQDFSWSEHGRYYDYLLLRHAPAELSRDLERTCNLIAVSGPWVLFQNKTIRKNW